MRWNVGYRAYDVTPNFCNHDFATLRKLRHLTKNVSHSGPIRILATELFKGSECEPIDCLRISLVEVSEGR